MLVIKPGPLPSASPGIDRYEIVLNSVANIETPISTGWICPLPMKYSRELCCLRPMNQPSHSVDAA